LNTSGGKGDESDGSGDVAEQHDFLLLNGRPGP
jgi:hypothetical protein